MKRRGFTLIELLTVVAIMGILLGVTVANYQASQRGMEERSVIQNVNQFIRSAYQRAQIDRQPVTVYFWNETLKSETANEPPVVVGHAVAVRRAGRLTRVKNRNILIDEFGDLSFRRLILDEDESGETFSRGGKGGGIRLYKMNGDEGDQEEASTVYETTRREPITEPLLLGGEGTFECYAFEVDGEADDNTANWQVGDAYGFEFAEIQLPHGYLFGKNYSKSVGRIVDGKKIVMRFCAGANTGNGSVSGTIGRDTIEVCTLKPDKSGELQAITYATSDSPTKPLSGTKRK